MNAPCDLCIAINDDYRILKKTKHSFVMVCKRPLNEGHLLILPRRHITSLEDFSDEEAKDLFNLLSECKNLLLKKRDKDPTLHMNFKSHSSQEHVHFHLLPTKGNLRDTVSAYEGISRSDVISMEAMKKLKDNLIT